MGREGRCTFTKSRRLAAPHSHCHSKQPDSHTLTHRQGDTPGFHAPALATAQRSHIYTQTHTVKHVRHLDLVFVVSRKVSVPKRGGRRGEASWAVKPVALSGCLRS